MSDWQNKSRSAENVFQPNIVFVLKRSLIWYIYKVGIDEIFQFWLSSLVCESYAFELQILRGLNIQQIFIFISMYSSIQGTHVVGGKSYLILTVLSYFFFIRFGTGAGNYKYVNWNSLEFTTCSNALYLVITNQLKFSLIYCDYNETWASLFYRIFILIAIDK